MVSMACFNVAFVSAVSNVSLLSVFILLISFNFSLPKESEWKKIKIKKADFKKVIVLFGFNFYIPVFII